MQVVIDTSIVIAFLVSEKERNAVVDLIDGYELVCPKTIRAEVGNAVSAMFKRKRITLTKGLEVIQGFENLTIQTVPLNLRRATELCHQFNIYAYDAYVLECAERLKLDLVTLDRRMKEIASELGITVIEV